MNLGNLNTKKKILTYFAADLNIYIANKSILDINENLSEKYSLSFTHLQFIKYKIIEIFKMR